MNIEQIARICHEANRAFCVSIGDLSQVPWDEAPEWQRASTFNSVRFHLEHPDAPASSSHDIWMREKVEAGWRRGEVKDAEAKTHPSIIPFEELSADEQAKDHLIRGIIHSLAPFVD